MAVTADDDQRRALRILLDRSAQSTDNESASRSANDRFVGTIARHGAPTDRVSLACECGAPLCREIVTLTIEEYERVRADRAWFLVSDAHHNGDTTVARRVGDGKGYVIIEKIGAQAEAERHDPRDTGSA